MKNLTTQQLLALITVGGLFILNFLILIGLFFRAYSLDECINLIKLIWSLSSGIIGVVMGFYFSRFENNSKEEKKK